MSDNKFKAGMSVREIEAFAKKNRYEVLLCVLFFLACVFSFLMWGTGWAVIAAFAGVVIGAFLSDKVDAMAKRGFAFVFKQESTTQIVLAVVSMVLAIVVPPLYFLLLGVYGGRSLYHHMAGTHHSHR